MKIKRAVTSIFIFTIAISSCSKFFNNKEVENYDAKFEIVCRIVYSSMMDCDLDTLLKLKKMFKIKKKGQYNVLDDFSLAKFDSKGNMNCFFLLERVRYYMPYYIGYVGHFKFDSLNNKMLLFKIDTSFQGRESEVFDVGVEQYNSVITYDSLALGKIYNRYESEYDLLAPRICR